jgi:hypothetical protein
LASTSQTVDQTQVESVGVVMRRTKLRAAQFPLVLVIAWALAACGGGSNSSTTSKPATPASTPATTYASKLFVVPFDATPPAWLSAKPNAELANFVTWETTDAARAIRFLVPVKLYRPGSTATTAVPKDYLAYLLSQATQGGRFTDVAKTSVGGRPATILTATTSEQLEGSLGCPKAGMAAEDCYGLQPDLVLRMAVVNLGDQTLLAWLRTSRSATVQDRATASASFEQMLASVRFSNRAVQAAPAGPVASPIDGVWRARWTHAELVKSPLTVLPDEDNAGNWGTYTLTFKRGRVTEAQSNRLGKWAGAGSFQLTGDVLDWTRDSGEHFVMRWSRKGNQLTLKRDETLGGGPTPFVIKPWVLQQ